MSQSFSGLPEPLQRALEEKGFTELTSVQKAIAEADTLARDLRITSQTGSGKTVAVGIAIARELLEAGPRTGDTRRTPHALVLTPTRELASQVQRELAWFFRYVPDASVEVVTGGTSVLFEKRSLAKGPRVVVGTPGRTLDHLTNGAFVGDDVRLVVLDEADQMLDMGFRDELEGILDRLPGRGRTHLLSATFAGEVLAVAQRYQKNPDHVEGSPLGSANRDIEHVAHVVPVRHRYDALVNILLMAHARRSEETSGRTLVFTRTRADTIEIAERLQKDGVRAEPLSGDLAQAQRTRTLSAFRSGHVSTLVATDVAARGLDVQGVDLVVHFDPPGDPDTFTHRSGRTGRAGQKGTSVVILPPQARRRVERLLFDAGIRPNWAPVPSADKIEKAFQKLGRRRIFQALETPADPDTLAYAEKLLGEHPPAALLAAMLSLLDTKPPTAPRDVSTGFSPEHPGPSRDTRGGRARGGPEDGYAGGHPGGARGGFRPRGPGEYRDRGPAEGGGDARKPFAPGGRKPGPRRFDGGFAPRPNPTGPRGNGPREFAPREGQREFAPRDGGFRPGPREGGFRDRPQASAPDAAAPRESGPRYGRPFKKGPNRPR